MNKETSASFDLPTDLVADTYYDCCFLSLDGASEVTKENTRQG